MRIFAYLTVRDEANSQFAGTAMAEDGTILVTFASDREEHIGLGLGATTGSFVGTGKVLEAAQRSHQIYNEHAGNDTVKVVWLGEQPARGENPEFDQVMLRHQEKAVQEAQRQDPSAPHPV